MAVNWVDGVLGGTPITASNLNAMDLANPTSAAAIAASLSYEAKGLSSATQATLSSTYTSQSAMGIVLPAGASYSDVQAACNSAATFGTKVVAVGSVTTSSTLVITSDADFGGLTYNYTGSGVAVQVGAGGSGVRIDYKQVVTPTITNLVKTTTGWSQVTGSVGLRVVNANTCTIRLGRIRNFETNFEIRGVGAGSQYSTFIMNQLSNGFYGQRFTADATGWVNQNTFIGGRIDMDSGEGNRVSGTRYVLIENTANAVNGNVWNGTAFEGDQAEYAIETNGQYNVCFGCRFESSLGPRVWWRAAATRNAIVQGYGAVAAVTESGALRNQIIQAGRSQDVTVSSTSGAFNLQNDSSGAAPALTVMDPGTPLGANDPATAYAWAQSALLLKGKRAADSFDRVQVDANAGRILFGDGTAAPTAALSFDSAALLKIASASLFPASDNTQDLGINATRWRYIRARTAVFTGAAVTGSRPAASIGVGAMFFDTTLKKPIWSDGTGWFDATGTAV